MTALSKFLRTLPGPTARALSRLPLSSRLPPAGAAVETHRFRPLDPTAREQNVPAHVRAMFGGRTTLFQLQVRLAPYLKKGFVERNLLSLVANSEKYHALCYFCHRGINLVAEVTVPAGWDPTLTGSRLPPWGRVEFLRVDETAVRHSAPFCGSCSMKISALTPCAGCGEKGVVFIYPDGDDGSTLDRPRVCAPCYESGKQPESTKARDSGYSNGGYSSRRAARTAAPRNRRSRQAAAAPY
jgi:hypothetical protein